MWNVSTVAISDCTLHNSKTRSLTCFSLPGLFCSPQMKQSNEYLLSSTVFCTHVFFAQIQEEILHAKTLQNKSVIIILTVEVHLNRPLTTADIVFEGMQRESPSTGNTHKPTKLGLLTDKTPLHHTDVLSVSHSIPLHFHFLFNSCGSKFSRD